MPVRREQPHVTRLRQRVERFVERTIVNGPAWRTRGLFPGYGYSVDYGKPWDEMRDQTRSDLIALYGSREAAEAALAAGVPPQVPATTSP